MSWFACIVWESLFKYLLLCSSRKKIIQVWIDMTVNKWWQVSVTLALETWSFLGSCTFLGCKGLYTSWRIWRVIDNTVLTVVEFPWECPFTPGHFQTACPVLEVALGKKTSAKWQTTFLKWKTNYKYLTRCIFHRHIHSTQCKWYKFSRVQTFKNTIIKCICFAFNYINTICFH